MIRPLRDILFLDLETVSATETWGELSQARQQAWEMKAESLQREGIGGSIEDLYQQEAGLYAEYGKIVALTVGYFHEREDGPELRVKTYTSADSEKSLLDAFQSLVEERFDQKTLRLCSHHGKEFHIPFLCRRMLVHCVPLPPVLDFAGKKPWEVPHLDTAEMWMFGNRRYPVSLFTLCSLFNIPYAQHADGTELHHTFYKMHDFEQISQWSQQDVIATAQLYLRYRCEPTLPEDRIVRV
jgi:hypothetical protein